MSDLSGASFLLQHPGFVRIVENLIISDIAFLISNVFALKIKIICVLVNLFKKREIMKKLALLLTVVLIVQYTQGQIVDSVTTDTNQKMYEFLMAKHKKQKKTGLILLGSGLAATGLGVLIIYNDSDWFEDEDAGSDYAAGTILYTAGVLSALSSIPVLIIAGENRQKAQIYAQIGQQRMMDFNLENSNAMAVGVKIQF